MGTGRETMWRPTVAAVAGKALWAPPPGRAAGVPADTLEEPRVLGTRHDVTARRRLVVAGAVVLDSAAIAAAFTVVGSLPLSVYLTLPGWIASFAACGLYDRRHLGAGSQEARKLFHALAVSVLGMLSLLYVIAAPVPRSSVATLGLSVFACAGASRALGRRAFHVLNARGFACERVLVVGTNEEARLIARTLRRKRWVGYAPAGFVATSAAPLGDWIEGLPVVGDVDHVLEAVAACDATAVILASSDLPAGTLRELTTVLQSADVDLRISAGLTEVAASRMSVEPLDGLAMLAVRRNELTAIQSFFKRSIDVVVSAVALVAVAPAMAVMAMLVRRSGPGPVLFSQTRIGKGGEPFTIYKFRTMVVDAERRRPDLELRNDAMGLLFKVREDPRVTPIGRLLRASGLDELPQLFNVLRGDMSIVGPRPPLPDETARYDEWTRGRLNVKPGITGLWQINGRHELDWADYVRYDLFYVENWSVALDLYVIARTLPALISRRGAC